MSNPSSTGAPYPPSLAARGSWRPILGYGAFVVLPVVALLVVLEMGSTLSAPLNPAAITRPPTPAADAVLRLPLLLTQIATIIAVSRLVGAGLRKLGQPQVVGEMIAGLMLGPSLLGFVYPAAYQWLFPRGTVRFINALSQIGLVLFMFLLGLELDLGEVARRSKTALLTSHASIAVPMFLGGALALFLYSDYAAVNTPFFVFALFLGCAMSVTAFPVLARILDARRISRTPFGAMVLACAALADVTAWALLAFVLAVAGQSGPSRNAAGTVAITLGGLAAYVIVMITGVRRILQRWWDKRIARLAPGEQLTLGHDALSGVLFVILVSAVATDLAHVHALFGAFVAGVVMPRDPRLAEWIRVRFEDLLAVLLLPLFFAFAGLRANVMNMSSAGDWIACGAIVLVAIVGKIGGGSLAARSSGSTWREASALGVLMNARGLMELVLLTIGLQAGIITPKLYTLMVVMAIFTTVMTSPMLTVVLGRRGIGPVSEGVAT